MVIWVCISAHGMGNLHISKGRGSGGGAGVSPGVISASLFYFLTSAIEDTFLSNVLGRGSEHPIAECV